jgi:hypothetical protein
MSKGFSMKKLLPTLAMLLLGLTFAQPNIDPKQFEAVRPMLELMSFPALLGQMDQQKGLGIAKAQAKKLIPILEGLPVLWYLNSGNAVGDLGGDKNAP